MIGSGVFINDQGWIVTNFHVVQGAQKVVISTAGGEEAESTGYFIANPEKDLAVIACGPGIEEIKPLFIASRLPRKGERVAAFGAPLGFSFSATEGVVSSLRTGEEIRLALKNIAGADIYQILGYHSDTSWIQTSAAISGGNSGGPLVDMRGRLVGINTWTVPKAQSMNFAADLNEVKSVIERAGSASKRPFAKLPSNKIEISMGNIDGSRSNRELSPREKAIRDLVESRRKEMQGRNAGTENIYKAIVGEQFEKDTDRNIVKSYPTKAGVTRRVKISSDQQFLAVNSKTGSVHVFDLESGELLYQIKSKHKLIRDIAFSSHPTRLYTLRDQGRGGSAIAIRDPTDGSWNTEGLELHGSNKASSLAVSEDGRSVFANFKSYSAARFWRFASTLDSYKTFSLRDVFGNGMYSRQRRYATSSLITQDGVFLVTGFADGWITASSGAGDRMSRTHERQIHIGEVFDMTISPDGKWLASVSEDGELVVTNFSSSKWPGRKWSTSKKERLGVAFSSDGMKLATTVVGNVIEIYDTKTKELSKEIRLPALGTDLEFISGDRFLVVGSIDGVIRIVSVD